MTKEKRRTDFSLSTPETKRTSSQGLAHTKLHRRQPVEAVNPLGSEQKNVPNPWVEFRINDVYVPEPAQILTELHGKDVMLGRIVDISNSNSREEPFAVVEVEGLSQPVIVAMKYIKEIRCE